MAALCCLKYPAVDTEPGSNDALQPGRVFRNLPVAAGGASPTVDPRDKDWRDCLTYFYTDVESYLLSPGQVIMIYGEKKEIQTAVTKDMTGGLASIFVKNDAILAAYFRSSSDKMLIGIAHQATWVNKYAGRSNPWTTLFLGGKTVVIRKNELASPRSSILLGDIATLLKPL